MKPKRYVKGVENPEVCAVCEKPCCEHMPGVCIPADFGTPNLPKLFDALESGKYAIDWWEGNPMPMAEQDDESRLREAHKQGYFVRPATKKEVGNVFDPSWGGECVFLTEKGCELPLKKRPAQCRVIVPVGGKCEPSIGFNKQEVAQSWWPYRGKVERKGNRVMRRREQRLAATQIR